MASCSGIDKEIVKVQIINLPNAEPEGGLWAPDRTGPQAPVSKLSRQWPFDVGILAVAQRRIFLVLIHY